MAIPRVLPDPPNLHVDSTPSPRNVHFAMATKQLIVSYLEHGIV